MSPRYDLGGVAWELPPLPDDLLDRPGSGRTDPRALFPDAGSPFEIEVGPGKGSFLLAAARHDPGVNFLGIEHAGDIWAYACDRVRRAGLANVRLVRADAVALFRWRLASAIARVVHVYYSDPWPKARHHKNRVLRDEFAIEARRVLAPGGELRIVTDHDAYWSWIEAHADGWVAEGLFERRAFIPPPWAAPGTHVETNYERKMTGPGRPPHALTLVRAP